MSNVGSPCLAMVCIKNSVRTLLPSHPMTGVSGGVNYQYTATPNSLHTYSAFGTRMLRNAGTDSSGFLG